MDKERKRVTKDEKYWHINMYGVSHYMFESYSSIDNALYDIGNYFNTKEEAESMANKLRAVLKGAEVIEMPSEEEWKQISYSLDSDFEDCQLSGIRCAYDYLNSKTIK